MNKLIYSISTFWLSIKKRFIFLNLNCESTKKFWKIINAYYFFCSVILTFTLITSTAVFANDVDDILRNLESPDVDYHIDKDIKIIVPQSTYNGTNIKEKKQSNTKFILNNETIGKNNNTSSQNIKINTNKNNKEKNENKSVEKSSLKKILDSKNQSINTKVKRENNQKSENKKTIPTSKNEKTILKNENSNAINKRIEINIKPSQIKSNPIKVYNLYKFFINLPFVQQWTKDIKENLNFCKNLSYSILDFWQEKYLEEQKESNEGNTEKNNDKSKEVINGNEPIANEEEEETNEEETEPDYSKFDKLVEKVEELFENKKYDEIQELFEENAELANVPAILNYRLKIELLNKNPNLNSIRNISSSILNNNPNSIDGNYGMAYYYFHNKKKRDLSKASNHIAKAIKGKRPMKEALQLSKEITIAKFLVPSIIAVIIIIFIIIAIIVIIKKKKANKNTESSINENNEQINSESNSLTEAIEELINKDIYNDSKEQNTSNAQNKQLEKAIDSELKSNEDFNLLLPNNNKEDSNSVTDDNAKNNNFIINNSAETIGDNSINSVNDKSTSEIKSTKIDIIQNNEKPKPLDNNDENLVIKNDEKIIKITQHQKENLENTNQITKDVNIIKESEESDEVIEEIIEEVEEIEEEEEEFIEEEIIEEIIEEEEE